MYKALLASVILWPLMWLSSAVLWVMGVPICAMLAKSEAWKESTNYLHPDRVIKVWKPKWAWLWSNKEDGVTGHPGWQEKYAKYPRWGAFVWSAWRNPSNNLRFVKGVSLKIDPTKIGFKGNASDPPKRLPLDAQPPVGDVKWSFTWQGLYTGLVWRKQLTKTRHFQIRLGWKLLPKDAEGVSDDDYRKLSCGFGTQLHLFRKD